MNRNRSRQLSVVVLRLAGWLNRPPVWLGAAGAWLLLPMIAVIAFDVIGRKYVRHLDVIVENGLHLFINSPKLQDSEWHFSASLIALALGYACSRNIQIRLDIVRRRFSDRCKIWIEFLGTLVLLPFLAVLVYYAGEFVALAWESGERSAVLTGLSHRWAIKAVLLLGLTTLLMAAFSLALRCAVWLFGPPELRQSTDLASLTERPGQNGELTKAPPSS